MRERNKIILEYGTYMLSLFCQLHSVTGKMVLCFGNYSDGGSCLFVCTLGKGKWKPCGTEGSVYTCLGRGPGNQLSETQYITGYMDYITWLSIFCDIYSILE